MPYILVGTVEVADQIDVEGFEPEIEPTPWLASMLKRGRAATDKPGTRSPLTKEMKAQFPRIIWVGEPHRKGVPDVIVGSNAGLIISRRVKDKLEELEPRQHDFFPIEMRRKKTGEKLGDYFILYLHHKPDVIDFDKSLLGCLNVPKEAVYGIEKSQHSFRTIRGSSFKIVIKGNTYGRIIAFKPGSLDGIHLWRGTVGPFEDRHRIVHTDADAKFPNLTYYNDGLQDTVFASDEFADFIKKEKIRGWQCEEIWQKPDNWFFDRADGGMDK